VIFVTVGSHPTYPFLRLLDALPLLAEEELFVQYGPAPRPEGVAEARQWLEFSEVLDLMTSADAVISHAGAGTIIGARNLGLTPVVVPRLARFAETVDDHQVELAHVFERTGVVLVAWDLVDLPQLVEKASKLKSSPVPKDLRLHRAVRAALTHA
jgi:UDP-N-acetylglucosamine transferase subunit ALG13